jgi:hypothetical protein
VFRMTFVMSHSRPGATGDKERASRNGGKIRQRRNRKHVSIDDGPIDRNRAGVLTRLPLCAVSAVGGVSVL